jgi:capsular polysaccharide transport system permease protein
MTYPLAGTSQPQIVDQTIVGVSRAALISKSLKSIARRARTPRSIWVPIADAPERRWQHIFVWAVLASFGLVVFLPMTIAGVYLTFIASNQYSSESSFALRGGEPTLLNSLSGLQSLQLVQDSMIVTDFIESRSMVEAVNQSLNLRQLFARDHVDFFSRFNPKNSDEELVYYWRRHVQANIDPHSGVISILVRAFTPQDSLNISNKIVAQSEALVNELSERARRDALRQAQTELNRAKQVLLDKTQAMQNMRNAEGLLDSGKTSEVMTQMLGDMRLELARLEQEYSAQRRTILPTSPQLRVLEARIDSMKEQIRRIEGQMTGAGSAGTPALSAAMSRFDREKLESSIAEKQYVAAAAEYERARIEIESHHAYLATFLKPVLAQEALYPKRMWLWSIVTVISLLLWASGVGIGTFVRNHMTV